MSDGEEEVRGGDYEYVAITNCEVRWIDPVTNGGEAELELWWRIKWNTGTTTLEPESSFDLGFNDIVIYAAKHRKAIQAKIDKALKLYPTIKEVVSSYFPVKPEEVETVSDVDLEDFMEGNSNDESEEDSSIRQAAERIMIESEEGQRRRTLNAEVTAKGELLMTAVQLAMHFALRHDSHLMLGAGQYLAQRNRKRFIINKHIMSAGVPMKIWGTPIQDTNANEGKDNCDTPERWPPPPWIKATSFGTDHLNAVYNWLNHHKVDAHAAKGKDFAHNTRRRYYVKLGKLYYKRGRRAAKNLPKRILRTQIPDVEVVRQGQAWLLVEEDHNRYHDGHNRTEERLGALYMIVRVRAMTKYARDLCKVCESFEHTTKDVVRPIITSRPMELIMFDLFFLPFKDNDGHGICMMIIDHFTKYKWGGVMTQKTMHEVADILIRVFQTEGTCERWHCDNGSEFLNHIVEMARKALGIPSLSSGRPRHPQCQGLVERANGTCKRKILMKSSIEGLQNGDVVWNWKKHLEEVLMQENDAPLKVYKGLNAFFCLRNRQRDHINHRPINPEDMATLWKYMRECQEEQGAKVVGKGIIPTYQIDDIVKVRAGYEEVKKRTVVGQWTTEATICEIHETTPNFYKLKWITRGLNKEAVGAVSKRWFPWSALKLMGKEESKEDEVVIEDETGEHGCEEDVDFGNLGDLCEDDEQGKKDDVQNPAVEPRALTMTESMGVMRTILEEVATGEKVPWNNHMNSCHVDSFLMLEVSAIVCAPWRIENKEYRRAGKQNNAH